LYFHDKIEIGANKKACIMRDGVYLYTAGEMGLTDRNPNQVIPVYRDSEEVRKAYNAFKKYNKIPITVNHPDTFLNLKDSSSYANGYASNPYIKDDESYLKIYCDMELKDSAFKDYSNGVRELSCGWDGEFVKNPVGSTYEFNQVFIDLNHIAMVESGRCGSVCKITDGGIKMADKVKKVTDLKLALGLSAMKNENFLKIMKDCGVKDFDEEEEIGEIEKLKQTIEKLSTEHEALKGNHDSMKKDYDALKAKDYDGMKKSYDELFAQHEELKKKSEEEKGKMTDKATLDKAIVDAVEKGIQIGKDEFKERLKAVLPIIKMGEFEVKDFADKTPCDIKRMVIGKLSNKECKITDTAILDTTFDTLMATYEHKGWKGHVNIEDHTKSLAKEIDNISFKKEGGN
jgi:hypothetical protein